MGTSLFVANVLVSPAVDELHLASDWLVKNKYKWAFAEGTTCAANWLIHVHQREANDVAAFL